MESSESTRSIRGEPSIWLGLIVRGDDRAKACTGRRLLDWQKVRRFAPGSDRVRRLLLDPHAPEILSRRDDQIARTGGVVVVDCSWNRLARRPAALDEAGPLPARLFRRRLPLLLAANPQHFGRLAELNTVEAFAAALYLVGAPGRAAEILGGFRGGTTFLTLNRERLDAYRDAATPDEVRSAERRLFGGPVTP
ncbi:MAG: ribosome biogenesis domain-containing protein [Thermoplasmata archaeon]